MMIEDLIGKTIKHIEVDGFEITITTEDEVVLTYYASDAGYSSWNVSREGEDGED